MTRKQIKFKFSAKEVSFEFEGDLETGERVQKGVQQSLAKLIDTPALVLPSANKGDMIDGEVVTNGKSSDLLPDESKVQGSRRATRRQSRPRGTSPAARIKVLHEERYFAHERSLSDIQEALAQKGFNFESNEISAALLLLVRKGPLDRRKDDNGNYVYFNKVQNNGQGGNGGTPELSV
jgi:hypothetical protein